MKPNMMLSELATRLSQTWSRRVAARAFNKPGQMRCVQRTRPLQVASCLARCKYTDARLMMTMKSCIHLTARNNMFIQVEETTNPNSLKFYPGEAVLESGTADFQDEVQASMKSPLARALFEIKGVKSVSFAQDFITVTKEDDDKIAWAALEPQIFSEIRIFYSSKHPIVYSSVEHDTHKKKVTEEWKKTQKKVFTVPNILTFSRIATTPAIGYFIWNGMNSHAFACFAFAAATDLLDGLIARTFNQQSDLGTTIDPIADKLLLSTCLIAMYNTSLVPYWLVKGLIMRDFLILTSGTAIRYLGFDEKPGLKKFFDLKNYPTLGFEPTFVSKCCTALQCLLIGLTLSTQHMVGNPVYDMSIFGLQLVTAGTAAFSFSEYCIRFFFGDPLNCRPFRSKG